MSYHDLLGWLTLAWTLVLIFQISEALKSRRQRLRFVVVIKRLEVYLDEFDREGWMDESG